MKTLKEFKNEIELSEATDIAKVGNVQLTQFSLGAGKGLGIQVTSGVKQFAQLTASEASSIGKLLIKWAATQK